MQTRHTVVACVLTIAGTLVMLPEYPFRGPRRDGRWPAAVRAFV